MQMDFGAKREFKKSFLYFFLGGNTKFTWNCDNPKHEKEVYHFRVRVQTCEGVGNWSDIVTCTRAPPSQLISLIKYP